MQPCRAGGATFHIQTLNSFGRGTDRASTMRAIASRSSAHAEIAHIAESHRRVVASIKHVGRAHEHAVGNHQLKRLGGVEIDHQFEICGLLDRQIGRIGALEDLVDVAR